MLGFSRRSRLIKKQDFEFVFEKPHKLKRKYLIILYRSNQLACSRLGVITAKQYLKRAVDRNRVRRVIRESFRHQQALLKGLDIIVMVRSEWTPLAATLRDDIDSVWPLLTNSSKPV
jgi:ribonuclease P protein component